MFGFLMLVLVIGSLLARVYGRGVAQGFVTGTFMLVSVGIGFLILFVGFLLLITPSWRTQHPPDPNYYPGQNVAASGISSPGNSATARAVQPQAIPYQSPQERTNPFSGSPQPYIAPPPETSNTSPAGPSPMIAPMVPINIIRPRVGIVMRSLTPGEDAAIGLRAGIGQCVTSVLPGGGAAAANVIPGDEITKVYVRNTWFWVATQDTVTQAVEASPAGSWTWMEMLRNGRIYRVRLRSAACVVGSR